MADCRASWEANGKVIARRDITQKIFFLNERIAIGFAGNIEFAGEIINFIAHQILRKPKLGNIHVLHQNAHRLVKYAYDELVKIKKREGAVGFIVAGVDFGRPEKIVDADGKTAGFMPFFDRRVFKITSPNFIISDTSVIEKPISILGEGEPALTSNLEEDFKGLQFSFALAGSLALSALTISGPLLKKAKELGLQGVGGMMQIAVIENSGFGFISYKSRSDSNTSQELDLELDVRHDGVLVQRNLITGEEVPLLLPPDVTTIKDPSDQIFAGLD